MSHQHVFIAVETGLVNGGLDAVEGLIAIKRLLGIRLHVLYPDEVYVGRLGLGCRHPDLLVSLR